MARIIAHRGSSKTHPENSRSAFRAAVKCGADALEVDLRRSLDGEIYCCHDYHLGRLTGYSGYLRRTSSEKIEKLKLYREEPILTFEKFLIEFAGKAEMILDIKSAGIEEKIVELIGRHGGGRDLIYSSFSSRILANIKTIAPRAKTALIVGPVRNLRPRFDFSGHLVRTARKLECSGLHLSRHLAREGIVKKLRLAGFRLAVWTVDDPTAAIQYKEMGIGGIITNVPEILVEHFHGLRSTSKVFQQ